jgi:hypothetical protein
MRREKRVFDDGEWTVWVIGNDELKVHRKFSDVEFEPGRFARKERVVWFPDRKLISVPYEKVPANAVMVIAPCKRFQVILSDGDVFSDEDGFIFIGNAGEFIYEREDGKIVIDKVALKYVEEDGGKRAVISASCKVVGYGFEKVLNSVRGVIGRLWYVVDSGVDVKSGSVVLNWNTLLKVFSVEFGYSGYREKQKRGVVVDKHTVNYVLIQGAEGWIDSGVFVAEKGNRDFLVVNCSDCCDVEVRGGKLLIEDFGVKVFDVTGIIVDELVVDVCDARAYIPMHSRGGGGGGVALGVMKEKLVKRFVVKDLFGKPRAMTAVLLVS